MIEVERDFQFLNGHQVFVAGSIEDGLRLLDEEHPDVIFLVNSLSDGLGWETTEFIGEKYPEAHSNLISADHVQKTITTFFRILAKPLQLEEIDNSIGI